MKLDGSLVEAHTALAGISLRYDWNWPEAEREFKRAIELNPNYATAHHWYALGLVSQERFDEAFVEIKQAQELDPLSLNIRTAVGTCFYYARQYDRAIEQYKQTVEMDPNFALGHEHLMYAYAAKGIPGEAVKEWERALTLSGESKLAASLASGYERFGYRGAVRSYLKQVLQQSEGQYVSSLAIASFYAQIGDNDQAVVWLERAFDERDSFLTFLKVYPVFDGLHSDTRFRDLVRRIGLRPL